VNVYDAGKIFCKVEALSSTIMVATWHSRKQLCDKHSKEISAGATAEKYKHLFSCFQV